MKNWGAGGSGGVGFVGFCVLFFLWIGGLFAFTKKEKR